jgi:16S rRNA (cytosine967-C5)-methyltransferase
LPKFTPSSISPARLAAFDSLLAVEEGSYASDDLRLRSVTLAARDAGLAAQIVFGCLRFQNQLDYLLARYSGRQARDLDPAVRVALRAAIFQMRYLERVPAHAAVHNSVEFVKKRQRAATGLANAVLRKVNREPVPWPDRATAESCPEWLMRRWQYSFGEEQALGIARAALVEPNHYVRIPESREVPAGLDAEATTVPGCYRLRAGPSGTLRFHDIGSQSIVPLLQLEAGQSYLDLCAAPGNKSSQALETPLGLAVLCDASFDRLQQMSAQAPRLLLDATEPLPFSTSFERILVDAPCTGTGTLAGNPEIKWRIKPADFSRFHAKQTAILSNALRALSPQGRLVYATCSLEHEENEDVVKEVLADFPSFQCQRQVYRIPGRDEGDGFYAAVISASDPQENLAPEHP